MSMRETARRFFDACETGKGWDACAPYCKDGATFSAQADALNDVKTVEDYANWMHGMMPLMPDAHYDLKFFGVDEDRQRAAAAAVYHGTHTGGEGDHAPTGKSFAGDYVFVMDFDGDRIVHVNKVWNDVHSLRQLGWME